MLKIGNFTNSEATAFFFFFPRRGLPWSECSQTVLYLVTGPVVRCKGANLLSKLVFVCSSFWPFMVKKSEARTL